MSEQGTPILKGEICKVDDSLGLVLGFAIVCKVDGEAYFDVQGHYIPEETMLEAAADFMQSARIAKDMHTGDPQGEVVFAMPLTEEIAKAFHITEFKKSGLMIGMKPNKKLLKKFQTGEYTGFSIGGVAFEIEDVKEG